MDQGFGSHVAGNQKILRFSFWTALDQHSQQVDRVLQAHNEQVQVVLQQQISSQNELLLNFAEAMARDVLVRKNEEVSHLHMELQNTQEVLQTALQERDEWMYIAQWFYEMNKWLISQMPPMQATNPHAQSLSTELESTGSCSQALDMEGSSVGRTNTSVLCKLCCVRDACMLIRPCQHLCACKSCGINLTVCPICYSAKHNVIEARFG